MGSFMNSVFGGGYSAPEPVKTDPLPVRGDSREPEAAAVRDTERRRLRARAGASQTILTSPLGATGANILGQKF